MRSLNTKRRIIMWIIAGVIAGDLIGMAESHRWC